MTLKRSFLLVITLTALLSVCTLPFSSKVSAVTGAEFQSGRIMDDGVFFNTSTFSATDVQTFLNSKVPTCDTNGTQAYGSTTRAAYGASKGYPAPYTCLKDYSQDTPSKVAESGLCSAYTGGTKTAAQIIYDVGKSCGVSPKALIVLLEKEQSLVTDDWPWSIQYRSATGYGCPDTAACDSQYYGFFNQVYSAARQFRRYQRDSSLYNYRAARNNNIQYHPNAGCGSSSVYIQNQATAGLYNYTPYQPNAAALANLYGSGDGCSAYGNRNFWRLYNDWFGTTFGSIHLVGAPASISWGSNRIDVFGRGVDGVLWQKYFDGNNGGWSPWSRQDGVVDSNPAVASWGSGRLDIFAKGTGGDLVHQWYSGGWGTWESLGKPPTASIASGPGAISWGSNRIDVFVKGSDDALWQKYYDGNNGGWSSWVKLGGAIDSAPTITSWNPGRLDIFSKGIAGDLQHYWYDGSHGGWKNWESFGTPPVATGSPSAISWESGRIDIFFRASDGLMWQKWFGGSSGWQPWNRFGGAIRSGPTSASWEPYRLDEFATGQDGDLRHLWFGKQGWGYWESLGKPV